MLDGIEIKTVRLAQIGQNINPFVPNASSFYSLKTENHKIYSDLFRWQRKGALGTNGLTDAVFHINRSSNFVRNFPENNTDLILPIPHGRFKGSRNLQINFNYQVPVSLNQKLEWRISSMCEAKVAIH